MEVAALEPTTLTPSRDALNAGKSLPERTHHSGAGERPTRDSDQAMKQQQNKETKENPAKGRVSQLLIGRDSLFPLRKETLLTN